MAELRRDAAVPQALVLAQSRAGEAAFGVAAVDRPELGQRQAAGWLGGVRRRGRGLTERGGEDEPGALEVGLLARGAAQSAADAARVVVAHGPHLGHRAVRAGVP